MQNIDLILYVNLDRRTDRRKYIEGQLKPFIDQGYIDREKVVRVPGVVASIGILGSTRAHINALKRAIAMNAETVLIHEDDFTYAYSPAETDRILAAFFEHPPPGWEALLITYACTQQDQVDSAVRLDVYNDICSRLLHSGDTSGYIVRRSMFQPLIDIWERAAASYPHTRSLYDVVDVRWCALMSSGNWYIINRRIGEQDKSISNNVSY